MLRPQCCIILWVLATYMGSATSDYYTSVSGLELLLEVEGQLLKSFDDFVRNFEYTYDEDLLKALDHINEEHQEAMIDPFDYLSNPISAFKLLKRFVVDWSVIDEQLKSDPATKELVAELTDHMNDELEQPTEDDLKGAALGMVRLQETYGLNATDLAAGILLGTQYGSEMSASDCFELGMSLSDNEHHNQALPWVTEALEKLKREPFISMKSMTETMRYLAMIYFNLGNSTMSLQLTDEILQIDPDNDDGLKNKKIYEEKAYKERHIRKRFRQPFAKPKTPKLSDLYRRTCRGDRHQTPTEQRPLRCMYSTNGIAHRLIGPFKVEQLSLDPLILYYHQVITDSQIDKAIEEAEPIIVRSTVGELKSTVSEIRTSKTGWLYYDKHEFLNDIANLLTDITGLSLETAEPLQIVNYGIGGHYAPHWDFSTEPIKAFGEQRGNRIATALFYINDVELGGGTAFPYLKLNVQPVKGSLVLWYNLHESLEPDFRTKHAGCPVLKGSKWILNEWFHERAQDFLRPCSLKQQGGISEAYSSVNVIQQLNL